MLDGALLPVERRKLRDLIARQGLNQAGLAIRLHANESYVSKLLNGRAGASLAQWREICAILDASLAELFDDAPPAPLVHRPQDLIHSLETDLRRLRESLEGQPLPTAYQPSINEGKAAYAAGSGAITESARPPKQPASGRARLTPEQKVLTGHLHATTAADEEQLGGTRPRSGRSARSATPPGRGGNGV